MKLCQHCEFDLGTGCLNTRAPCSSCAESLSCAPRALSAPLAQPPMQFFKFFFFPLLSILFELVVFITAAIHFHLKWFLKQKEIIKIKNCYFTYKKVFFSRNKNLFFCSVSGLGSRPWWTEWPGPASGQPKMHNRIRINRDQDL